MDTTKPTLVISVLVLKEGRALLNYRLGSFAHDMFGTPGGKLDPLETFQQCAERETAEEAGVKISNVRFLCLMNNFAHAPHHFVNVCVVADWVSGEPQVLEPEKCRSWEWYDLDHLPTPLTEVTACLMACYKSGENYVDAKPLNQTL